MTDDKKAIQGAAVGVIAGGVICVIGVLMPWINAQGGFVIIDRSGVSYSGDAKVILVMAIVAALGGLGVATDLDILPSFVRSSAIILGLIAGGLTIYDWVQIQHKINDAESAGASGQVGAGVYLTLVGAVLMVAAGWRLAGAREAKAKGRWNPPPGWDTPPHPWRPSAKWRPDPSWPAAPADWQWWVYDDEKAKQSVS